MEFRLIFLYTLPLIFKRQKQVHAFLSNCISHYDEKEVVAKMDEEEKEKKAKKVEVEEDNPNQPY